MNNNKKIFYLIAFSIFLIPVALKGISSSGKHPNVIIVITDDQGYGDIGAHGNPMIKTPNIDKLYSESVRLTNFHVDPTCTPTRSALMSGRYSNRTGVWHTIMGRSLMAKGEVTIAEVFKANGYNTGMFGKWHLGDNYPHRPQDQGFDYVVNHGGGGVGQGHDYWGNNYFDDTYWRNGVPEKFEGYCTDIWFREANEFIERNKETPFFCYISTNAPHAPLIVDSSYSNAYLRKNVVKNMSIFYGMITNIDENLLELRKKLMELGIEENTILIFMTDNGTANGVHKKPSEARDGEWLGYNAHMRGRKGSQYEGGHRVPFYMHWPTGGLNTGRDVNQLTAHIDVKPTLADLCGLKIPQGPVSDGVTLKEIIYGDTTSLRDRTLFVHSQRIPQPEKWRKTAVMSGKWRLIDGKELYNMENDFGQKTNVYEKYPEIAEKLTAEYDSWWESLKPTFSGYNRIVLGNDSENPSRLMSHDWIGEKCAWSQGQVKKGVRFSNPWYVSFDKSAKYKFELYRWPKHLEKEMGCVHAKLTIGQQSVEMELKPGAAKAVFELDVEKGECEVQSWLTSSKGKKFGAYYVWVTKL